MKTNGLVAQELLGAYPDCFAQRERSFSNIIRGACSYEWMDGDWVAGEEGSLPHLCWLRGSSIMTFVFLEGVTCIVKNTSHFHRHRPSVCAA